MDDIQANLPRACKDVAVYAASATIYLEQLRGDSSDDEDEELGSSTTLETGIPALQTLLLSLAAKPNYTNLLTHVFDKLADIQSRCKRVLEKYEDDKDFTAVRKNLQQRIPGLISNLTNLYQFSIQDRMPTPWLKYDLTVSNGLRDVQYSWSGKKIYHQTFTHMVRERGVPTSRTRVAGQNLNKEIHMTYRQHVIRWGRTAIQTGNVICTLVDAPIQDLLKEFQRKFDRTSVDPDLKRIANDALQKTVVRIAAQHGNLIRDLEASIIDTTKNYSIEETLYSPVARQMAPAYIFVNLMQGCKGIIAQRHAELFKRASMLVDSMPAQIVIQASRRWNQLCERFVEQVEEHLTRLTEIMEELLENELDPNSKHAQVRDVLDDHLSEFPASLHDLQQMFPDAETAQDDDEVPIKSEEDDDTCGYFPMDVDVSIKSEDGNNSVKSEDDDSSIKSDGDDDSELYVRGLKAKRTVKRAHTDRAFDPVEEESEDEGTKRPLMKHRPAKRARDSTTFW